jgi:hypothetical protein
MYIPHDSYTSIIKSSGVSSGDKGGQSFEHSLLIHSPAKRQSGYSQTPVTYWKFTYIEDKKQFLNLMQHHYPVQRLFTESK